MTLVIDSSITLAWCFEDERTPITEAVFERVVATGAVVPSLWRFEVANGLQMAVRRERIDNVFRDETLGDLGALDIAADGESDAQAWSGAVKLAERHRLTVYDAAYLELAERRRLPLATCDRELAKAANAAAVEVLGA